MKTTTNLLILLLFIVSAFVACKGSSSSNGLLEQAQTVIETDPAQALALLDSIANPQDMDKDLYMQYIVTNVQAKYKLYKDVTGDTLIFKAQQYFNEKGNPNQAALANFYSGAVYRESKLTDNALNAFLQSKYYAEKAKNNLLIARCYQNIGDLYLEPHIMGSAITNYTNALNYYKRVNDSDVSQLQTINLIGRSFEADSKLDSAYHYFNNGLNKAVQINNKSFQKTFNTQLGVVFRQTKEYDKSKEHLDEALKLSTKSADSLRIYLNFSKLYTDKKELDLARYYTDLIKTGVTQNTSDETKKEIYAALAGFNQQQGNYKEALVYSNLEKEINEKIQKENNSQKLREIEQKYKQSLLEKELTATKAHFYLYLAAALVLLLVVFVYALRKRIKNNKLQHQNEQEAECNRRLEVENKLLKSDNALLNKETQNVSFLQAIYENTICQWDKIEKKIQAMMDEYGATQKPAIFEEITQLIADLHEKSNQQLSNQSKDFLLKKSNGEKGIQALTAKELIYLSLCYFRYDVKTIALIMKEHPSKKNHFIRKLGIRNKLDEVGTYDYEIEDILFRDDPSGRML